jgi:GT2 family glycosyltransferase
VKASVIIPTYNRKNLIDACLLSFNHQVMQPEDSFEVIVVDDGSTDGTSNYLNTLETPYKLVILYRERTACSSRSGARNAGIRVADGEVIIFLDGDHIVTPAFVAEHIRCHQLHSDIAVMGFRKFLSEPINIHRLKAGFSSAELPPIGRVDSRFYVTQIYSENVNNLETVWHLFFSCNISVRRSHLNAVGYFDEDFLFWGLEDCELGYRLHQEGLQFVYSRDAIIYHQFEPPTANRDIFMSWSKNMDVFRKKHPAIEVSLQEIIGECYPPHMRVPWINAYVGLESAVRALKGRFPNVEPATVIKVTGGEPADILEQICDECVERCVYIMDQTNDRVLNITTQTIKAVKDLHYYKISKDDAASIIDRIVGIRSDVRFVEMK